MTTFYEWPCAILPVDVILWSGGAFEQGRISFAELDNTYRVPGGRLMAKASFAGVPKSKVNWYQWLCGVLKGNIFRLPLDTSGQVSTSAAMKAAAASYPTGIPFSNGLPFSTGYGFRFQPTADVVSTVLEGETTVTLDLVRWPGVLTHGKLFGLGYGVYQVHEIEYDGTVATITFDPPARRDISAGELAELRPTLFCKAVNPDAFIAEVRRGQLASPGSLTFREVVDANLL
ncbi:hypothetical protein [Labrenzia sp. R5_0]|jgi:hypothetical protein|uniref:hypothetical protein n=1 Tax=Labrenzia sp. R5_0 TaxID=2821108 RepID=UPI001ADAD1DD|nr:hypothetical protein [Labrenzia sp. R5_0]MBO9457954.1 hypothetical protein [Labrenzia sp. R5_0]